MFTPRAGPPAEFPYFFVGTFIEAVIKDSSNKFPNEFPYFFVGTFIEAQRKGRRGFSEKYFPTFS